MQKLRRNDPCHCGSGLKYKKCCLSKDEANNIIPLANSQAVTVTARQLIDDMLDWNNVVHQQIAHYFYSQAAGHYDSEHIKDMLHIWHLFAKHTDPLAKKLGSLSSALEYVLCITYGYEITQKQLAAKYNVSVATLSQRANDIFDFLEDRSELSTNGPALLQASSPASINAHASMEKEISRIHSLMAQQDFASIEEANAFLQQHLNSTPNKLNKLEKSLPDKQELASDMVYRAWDERNLKRREKLAQDALLLDPTNGDAYNVLAQCVETPRQAVYLYKMGMQVESKRLGEAFFNKNKGHFWGLLQTRPFMRAKRGYAEMCAEMGNLDEAIKHYEQLLVLNPNDNQGIRDLLLTPYLETGNWSAAQTLIKQYEDENSACFNFAKVIIEYEQSGVSPRLSTLIASAVKQNPFVAPYLLGNKKLPRQMPDYIGFGDDNEAIVYVLTNQHLWIARPALLQLLPQRRN